MYWLFFLSTFFFKEWVNIKGTNLLISRTNGTVWRYFLNIALCTNMCLLNLGIAAVFHFLMMCFKHSTVSMKITFKMSYLWCCKWRLSLLCLCLRLDLYGMIDTDIQTKIKSLGWFMHILWMLCCFHLI